MPTESSANSLIEDWDEVVRQLVLSAEAGRSRGVVLGANELPSSSYNTPRFNEIPSVLLWVRLHDGYQRGRIHIPFPPLAQQPAFESALAENNIHDMELYIQALNATRQWGRCVNAIRVSMSRIRQAGVNLILAVSRRGIGTPTPLLLSRYTVTDEEFPDNYPLLLRSLTRQLEADSRGLPLFN